MYKRQGIWVDVVTGGSNELLERISEEAESPRADVMFGGGVDTIEVYRDYLEPYTAEGIEPVSYTHLDVYKRQPHPSSRRIFRIWGFGVALTAKNSR